jgi:hypothetical protein
VLPSLHASSDAPRAWRLTHAAGYGGGIGAIAATVRGVASAGGGAGATLNGLEILEAAIGFALLCASLAVLRNFLARRLIWPNIG